MRYRTIGIMELAKGAKIAIIAG
jgi:hypothetical protein